MFHLTLKSNNAKTGPIPVSTSSAAFCPDSCGLKRSGCYADGGPLAIHWRKVTDGSRGYSLSNFCDLIRNLPDGTLWRHNQAGDLPGDGRLLDIGAVAQLTAANAGKRGFTYTHYRPGIGGNAGVIREANALGFTVNLSADSLTEADALADADCGPVVTIVPHDVVLRGLLTPKGRRVVICPAEQRDDITCERCKLCAVPDRKVIIGFPVHGAGKAKAQKVFWAKS